MSTLAMTPSVPVQPSNSGLEPPAIFFGFALVCLATTALVIVASVIFESQGFALGAFEEGGLIGVLSSMSLTMASVLTLLIFYLKSGEWQFGNLFWLAMSAGCLFLALGELLQFHERLGWKIEYSSIGPAEYFRNWNDLIVIGYGVVAIAAAVLFAREILKSRTFAVVLAAGFVFYAIHTGIDSVIPGDTVWKDIPEEGAKLFSTVLLFLAAAAQVMAMIPPLKQHSVE